MKEKEFKFQIDRKHTVWVRENVEVKASNEEEAKRKIIDLMVSGEIDELLNSFSIMEDTLELMTIEENGGDPTEEILYEGDTIYYNDGDEQLSKNLRTLRIV